MTPEANVRETADAHVPSVALFDFLLGRTILSCSSITLAEPTMVFDLDFIAVLDLDGGTRAELLVDDDRKVLRFLGPRETPEIWGEFDVVQLTVVPHDLGPLLPLDVARVEVARAPSCSGRWEGPTGEWGTEYVLGAILWAQDGRGLALRTAVEDLVVESPGEFRAYVAQWWNSDAEWTERKTPDRP